jgi:hypothetical protein
MSKHISIIAMAGMLLNSSAFAQKPVPVYNTYTQTIDGVTLQARVLTEKESSAVFGQAFQDHDICPILVSITNNGTKPLIFTHNSISGSFIVHRNYLKSICDRAISNNFEKKAPKLIGMMIAGLGLGMLSSQAAYILRASQPWSSSLRFVNAQDAFSIYQTLPFPSSEVLYRVADSFMAASIFVPVLMLLNYARKGLVMQNKLKENILNDNIAITPNDSFVTFAFVDKKENNLPYITMDVTLQAQGSPYAPKETKQYEVNCEVNCDECNRCDSACSQASDIVFNANVPNFKNVQ